MKETYKKKDLKLRVLPMTAAQKKRVDQFGQALVDNLNKNTRKLSN